MDDKRGYRSICNFEVIHLFGAPILNLSMSIVLFHEYGKLNAELEQFE